MKRFQTLLASLFIIALLLVVVAAAFADSDGLLPFTWSPSEASSNPFKGEKFYVDPNSKASKQAQEWRDSRPADARAIQKIANQPATYYFSEWTRETAAGTTGTVRARINQIEQDGALPVLGAYAIPDRDCGLYSSGGVANAREYERWIQNFAQGIGDHKAVVVLEPDALAAGSCRYPGQQLVRFALIADAVETLKSNPRTFVYIDAGNLDWRSASTMASRLQKSGIEQADGFTLNISNFVATDKVIDYGKDISERVGGKHFIVDTSRNGNGAAASSKWCNPPGRALGPQPTANTGEPLVDAFYWMKWPGESDGGCDGAPPAGTWMPEYALRLAERADY